MNSLQKIFIMVIVGSIVAFLISIFGLGFDGSVISTKKVLTETKDKYIGNKEWTSENDYEYRDYVEYKFAYFFKST